MTRETRSIGLIISTVLFAIATVAGATFSWMGIQKYDKLLAEHQTTLVEKEATEQRLADLTATNNYVMQKLAEESSKNSLFESQIKEIMGTVGNLDKLSKTDEELLQKYSKIYFLNEHFVPENLAEIQSDYIYEKGKNISVHAKVLPFLEKMFSDAKSANLPIQVISGYRSFREQTSLKSTYNVIYGAGTANQFSADQGYSEHQLGTALDLTTPTLGASFVNFKNAEAYTWLKDNAHKYGFVLSYPENNQYYQFEPWHWRFVGVKLATRLHNEGEKFYDVDQRTIDNYLINIFD
jgi:LAS superfamily LD-carboxypeptidase LdcB